MEQIRYEPDSLAPYVIWRKKVPNLNPGFQRDSVWTPTDRKKLIDSILRKTGDTIPI